MRRALGVVLAGALAFLFVPAAAGDAQVAYTGGDSVDPGYVGNPYAGPLDPGSTTGGGSAGRTAAGDGLATATVARPEQQVATDTGVQGRLEASAEGKRSPVTIWDGIGLLAMGLGAVAAVVVMARLRRVGR